MKKHWMLFCLTALTLTMLGMGFYLATLQSKYKTQSRDIQALQQQLKRMKQEIFYLQSMNYSEYLLTKKHWDVIRKTYKNQNPHDSVE